MKLSMDVFHIIWKLHNHFLTETTKEKCHVAKLSYEKSPNQAQQIHTLKTQANITSSRQSQDIEEFFILAEMS